MKVYLDGARPLDENHRPEDGWVRVESVRESITLLKTGFVIEISINNELGDPYTKNEGYRILRWLEEQVMRTNFNPPEVMNVHAASPARMSMMLEKIQLIKRKVDERTWRFEHPIHHAILGYSWEFPAPFSQRLLNRIAPVLKNELGMKGLELDSVTTDPIEQDDILAESTNMKIVLNIQATTLCCRP